MSWNITQKSDNRELEKLMNQIREQIVKHGGGGIAILEKKFTSSDSDGRINLKQDLSGILKEIHVNLSPEQVSKLETLLDFDHNGTIDYDEFIYNIAPPLNDIRAGWVNKIFDKLDRDRTGRIPKEELARVQDVDARYNYICRLCDKRGDGVIDRQELIDFYREISPDIDSDDKFISLLLNTWKVK
ncbi:hypothetical protein M9Y10_005537 [Tritrichomonas musculus]|uniref:EF-hand domain-containing protein n=1 Tax=Tritrichomonas musculus TaxID=1915356 RepID=A0ABR2JCX1_9EUKA